MFFSTNERRSTDMPMQPVYWRQSAHRRFGEQATHPVLRHCVPVVRVQWIGRALNQARLTGFLHEVMGPESKNARFGTEGPFLALRATVGFWKAVTELSTGQLRPEGPFVPPEQGPIHKDL
jgi:hypothetical protein